MNKGFKSFKDIDAWKKGCRLAVNIYAFSNEGELKKGFGLRDQMRRASVSISPNMAEGFEIDSTKEFIRFLHIARGSCSELRTQLYIAQALDSIQKRDCEVIIAETKEISAMLTGLVKHQKRKLNTTDP